MGVPLAPTGVERWSFGSPGPGNGKAEVVGLGLGLGLGVALEFKKGLVAVS